jgi:hypothetical protein
VFSTKNRRKLIPDEIQPKLWSYVGGIARKNGLKAVVMGSAAYGMPQIMSKGNLETK